MNTPVAVMILHARSKFTMRIKSVIMDIMDIRLHTSTCTYKYLDLPAYSSGRKQLVVPSPLSSTVLMILCQSKKPQSHLSLLQRRAMRDRMHT